MVAGQAVGEMLEVVGHGAVRCLGAEEGAGAGQAVGEQLVCRPGQPGQLQSAVWVAL